MSFPLRPRTCPSIYKAQELLEVMEGFLVPISRPMWAELMRCRGDETSLKLFTLTNLQETLGTSP